MVTVVKLYFLAYMYNEHFLPHGGIRNLIKPASARRPSQQQVHDVVFIPQPFPGIFLFRHPDWPVVHTPSSWIGQCFYVVLT